jgi:hypothetical protein
MDSESTRGGGGGGGGPSGVDGGSGGAGLTALSTGVHLPLKSGLLCAGSTTASAHNAMTTAVILIRIQASSVQYGVQGENAGRPMPGGLQGGGGGGGGGAGRCLCPQS